MRHGWVAAMAFGLVVASGALRAAEPAIDVRGAWRAESYDLKDGNSHRVEGRIFFTDRDWTVLFFVMAGGEPKRASAEGGTYTLEGDRLVFSHFFNFSTGQAVGSLAESPLRMTVRDARAAEPEPCRVELEGDRLTLRFPSGNAMTFARSSRF